MVTKIMRLAARELVLDPLYLYSNLTIFVIPEKKTERFLKINQKLVPLKATIYGLSWKI